MTELRDARFKKALDAAPDSDTRPQAAIAHTIRVAARSAMPTPLAEPPLTWWQRLWHSAGRPNAPWNTAFATLVLTVLVTVLWVNKPVPGARPEDVAVADAPAPMTRPVPMPAPAAVAKSAAPAANLEVPVRPDTHSMADTPRAAGEVSADTQQPRKAATELAEQSQRTDRARAVAPMRQAPGADAAVAAAPMSTAPLSIAPIAAAPIAAAPSPAAPVAAAPPSMAAAAPPTAAAPTPIAPALAAQTTAPKVLAGNALDGWTQLQLSLGGRSAVLERTQAQALLGRLQSLLPRLSSTAAVQVPATAPDVQGTALAQGRTLATFTLWANTLRWQVPGQLPRVGSIADAEAQELMRLAAQALEATP